MYFDLTQLVPWARNACGDRPRATREEVTGDGTATIVLSNTGGIALTVVTVDGTGVDANAIQVDGNVLTFPEAPSANSDIIVNYGLTRYTDDEVTTFLCDAAESVSSDLPAKYDVNRITNKLFLPDPPGGGWLVGPNAAGVNDVSPMLLTLIVYKLACDIVADKANQAADDSIVIRDGDTSIDTSKASHNGEAALKRLTERYEKALMRAKHATLNGDSVIDYGWRSVYPWANFNSRPYRP